MFSTIFCKILNLTNFECIKMCVYISPSVSSTSVGQSINAHEVPILIVFNMTITTTSPLNQVT